MNNGIYDLALSVVWPMIYRAFPWPDICTRLINLRVGHEEWKRIPLIVHMSSTDLVNIDNFINFRRRRNEGE